MPLALFGSIGFQEVLIILAIVIFLFGARRIPELARGLGEGIRTFRTALKGDDADKPRREEGRSKDDAPRS